MDFRFLGQEISPLKMLSIVLEDKNINDQRASDIFLQKFSDDALLKGELEKNYTFQKCSFNIDQKAMNISKEEVVHFSQFSICFRWDLRISLRGYIAKLERDLDEKGL